MTAKNKEQGVEEGKEVSNIEAELKKNLQKLKDRVGAPPSNKVSTKGKKFTLPTGESDTAITGIILDWRYVLAHYPGQYNPKEPQDPDCFAIGTANPESGGLVPDSQFEEKYAENCGVCPMNKWGSDPNGKGKACKNQVRLLLIGGNVDDDLTPLTLYVSPSAQRNWSAYLTDLAKTHGLDVLQVLTEITFDPNESYPKLQFAFKGKHSNLQEVFALKQRHQDVVERPIELRNKVAA